MVSSKKKYTYLIYNILSVQENGSRNYVESYSLRRASLQVIWSTNINFAKRMTKEEADKVFDFLIKKWGNIYTIEKHNG